jgi:hypothetical protein
VKLTINLSSVLAIAALVVAGVGISVTLPPI